MPAPADHVALGGLGRDHRHLLTRDAGDHDLALGRADISSRLTREQLTVNFGVLHFGDHNLTAGVRPCSVREDFRTLAAQATRAFQSAARRPRYCETWKRNVGASSCSWIVATSKAG